MKPRLDARLVPTALLCWLLAGLLLGHPARLWWLAIGAAASLGLGLLACACLLTRCDHGSASVLRRVLATLVLPLLAAVAVCVSYNLQAGVQQLSSAVPLVGHAERVRVIGKVVTTPRVLSKADFNGKPRMVLEIEGTAALASARRGSSAQTGRSDRDGADEAGRDKEGKGGLHEDMSPCPGRIVVMGPKLALSRGDTVEGAGRLVETEPASKARALLLARSLKLKKPASGLQGVVAGLRRGLADTSEPLPPDAAALLPGITVGDTSGMPRELDDAMKASSLTHITAVSGAHVAIVLSATAGLLTLLGAGHRLMIALSGVVLVGFVVLVGPSESVLRSAVMGGVSLLALGLRRPRDALPALAFSVMALLLVDPWMSRSYGFALSVAATAALILIVPCWSAALARRLPPRVAEAIAVPAAAQAVCAPIIVLFAPQIPVYGIAANLVALPAVPFATIGGLATCLIRPIWETVSEILVWPAGLAAQWIATTARVCASLPGAVLPWPTGPGGMALASLVILVPALVFKWWRSRSGGAARAT